MKQYSNIIKLVKSKGAYLINSAVLSVLIPLLINLPSKAQQIIQDATLPNNTLIRVEEDTINIQGGTRLGNNLFHSFQEFSVPNGSVVYFNNAMNIENIISRVTGKSISNINGLIRANGVANLFLLNPNGIVVLPNARLNIGGSFLATTGNSIKFADGIEFNTKISEVPTLLTENVPIGLQVGTNPGIIKVQGTGHNIQRSDFFSPLDANRFSNGLQVNSNKALIFVGGDILLEGGVLSTKNGRVLLGSINNGKVNLSQKDGGWDLNYEKNTVFGDISLLAKTLVYVNSTKGIGDTINFQGHDIKILDESLVFSQNQGFKVGGEVSLNASNILEVKNTLQTGVTAIFTSNFGKTSGENIRIDAKNIAIEGAQIATTTFTDFSSGDITVNADKLELFGSSLPDFSGSAGINTFTYSSGAGGKINVIVDNLIADSGILTTVSNSSGDAGDLNIASQDITLRSASSLGSVTSGSGNSGNVFVNARDFIELIGKSPSRNISLIQAATYSSGNAGNLEVVTPKLFIRDGASISTNTYSSGNAGNLSIEAFNSIELLGANSDSVTTSSIDSSAVILDESLRARFRLPPSPSGDAGNLTLNAGSLNVADGAQISVRSDGSGNAGKIEINAKEVSITNNGSVNATTAVGQGGNIVFKLENLFLRDGSISTTAGEQGTSGDGGNITIDTKNLLSLGDSSITANAFTGKGGNIFINTNWFFSSRNSRFEASSQFGINGQVEINGFYLYPGGIKAAPEAIRATLEIASVCQSRSGGGKNKFVVTGIDNLLPSPNDLPSNSPIWQDNSLSGLAANNSSEELKSIAQEVTPIIEAQALINKSDGTVVLTAKSDQVTADAALFASLCSAEINSSKN